MIWRPITPAGTESVLRLTREPMPGSLQLVWGLRKLCAPPGCRDLRVYVVEAEGEVVATAMTWVWPDGGRYLGGLRFSSSMRGRPGRDLWKQGYQEAMKGVDFAWTSIGRDNQNTRRLLERNADWLPTYLPRLELSTGYIPLRRGYGRTSEAELGKRGLIPLTHRHAALSGGSGLYYHLARLCRLVPPVGKELQLLAATQPLATKDLRGYDGLIIVYPTATPPPGLPRLRATWHSTLYQVQWDRDVPLAPLPQIHGAWL